jgi:hypothetical protein
MARCLGIAPARDLVLAAERPNGGAMTFIGGDGHFVRE